MARSPVLWQKELAHSWCTLLQAVRSCCTVLRQVLAAWLAAAVVVTAVAGAEADNCSVVVVLQRSLQHEEQDSV